MILFIFSVGSWRDLCDRCFCVDGFPWLFCFFISCGTNNSSLPPLCLRYPCVCQFELWYHVFLLCNHALSDNVALLALCFNGPTCTLAFLCWFSICCNSSYPDCNLYNFKQDHTVPLYQLLSWAQNRGNIKFWVHTQVGMRRGMSHISWKIIVCGYNYIVLFSLKVFL